MNTTSVTILLVLFLAALLPACGDPKPTAPAPRGLALQSGERPFGGFGISAGQPSEERLQEIAPHMACVLSFRMPGENPYDQAALTTAAGGRFVQIGFDKAGLMDPAKRQLAYDAFESAMQDPERMTYFHCGSGNRVAALWACYRCEVEKKSVEDAIADGKAAGLTKLEPVVREILSGK